MSTVHCVGIPHLSMRISQGYNYAVTGAKCKGFPSNIHMGACVLPSLLTSEMPRFVPEIQFLAYT